MSHNTTEDGIFHKSVLLAKTVNIVEGDYKLRVLSYLRTNLGNDLDTGYSALVSSENTAASSISVSTRLSFVIC